MSTHTMHMVNAYLRGDDEIRDAEGMIVMERLPDGAIDLWSLGGGASVIRDYLERDGYQANETTDYTTRYEHAAVGEGRDIARERDRKRAVA